MLLAFTPLAAAQSSALPPEILLLSKIKRQAKQDLARIPDFTCLETIERTSRHSDSKPFGAVDVVLVEVAHVGDRELFAWPGASHFESANLGPMIGSGMVSNGEFVSHARSVFFGDFGIIHYAGMEEVRGRLAARYDYQVSAAFSGYTIHNAGREAVVAVKGSFWADSETADLLRLTAEAAAIPVALGVRGVSTVIDYSKTRIGTSNYLLPQAATVQIALDTGLEQRNRIEFTHCRQYSTESVLSFADPDMEQARGPVSSSRIVEVFLPPDLIVTTTLETPIDLAHARIGDAISAVLESDLKQKGRTMAPKGAVISGRLRLLQREKSGYTVGLEFTDLASENGHARFFAKLASVDSRYAQNASDAAPEPTQRSGIVLDLPMLLAGVATFFVPDRTTELPKGLRMQWRTIATK